MRETSYWTFRKHIFFSLALSTVSYLVDLLMNSGHGTAFLLRLVRDHIKLMNSEAASVGIIGGADGPTAVYITGGSLEIISVSNIVFFLVLLLLYKPIKKLFG